VKTAIHAYWSHLKRFPALKYLLNCIIHWEPRNPLWDASAREKWKETKLIFLAA
jgi:hypothetical protein